MKLDDVSPTVVATRASSCPPELERKIGTKIPLLVRPRSNLHPEQEHQVAARLVEELGKAALSNDVSATPIEELWLGKGTSCSGLAGLSRILKNCVVGETVVAERLIHTRFVP